MEFDEVAVMDVNEPVSKAISHIVRGDPCVVVTKNGEYYGIFTELDVTEVVDPSKEKLMSVVEKAPLLEEGIDVRDAINLFLSGKFKALPIKTRDGLKVVDRKKFLIYVKEAGLVPSVNAGEVMTVPPLTVESTDTIGRARELMRRNNVRRVIVTEDGKLAGVLAMKDILPVYEKPKDRLPFQKDKHGIYEQPVRDYMTEGAVAVSPTASLHEVIDTMMKAPGASIVVADGDRPVGMVSIRDIFELTIAHKEATDIHLSGLDTSDEEYRDEILDTIKNNWDKVKRMLDHAEYIAVHYKKMRDKGLRSRYDVHARVKGDRVITVSASDWDIRSATQMAMKELVRVVKKLVDKK